MVWHGARVLQPEVRLRHDGRTNSDAATAFKITIPEAIRNARNWEAGLTLAFIPKGTGVLLVPVPEREDLEGLARGASPEGYRDRSDRIR